MRGMPKGSDVVIVNFNAGHFLRDTVASVLQSPAVAQVFVIDNASTDGSLDLLSSIRDNRIIVVRNEANRGFAAGCNMGLALATSEYVLLLNPDCVVEKGAIERLASELASSERVGMAGPLLLNPDGSEQAGGRRVTPTPRRALVRAFGLSSLRRFFPGAFPDFLLHQEPLPAGSIEVEAISGACMMVRGAAIAEVGLLDEQYFLHCEDLDWCMRFQQRGWSIIFVPDAKVIHYLSVSTSQWPLSTEWYKHKGMIRFYRKFLRDDYSAPVMYLVVAGVWTRFVVMAGYLLVSRRKVKRTWKSTE
jgi:GT2 family glycosyltransferase